MPTVPLHTCSTLPSSPYPSPLPSLLHTPSGLAIIELQASINIPPYHPDSTDSTPIGKFVFPEDGKGSRVWLYVGKHQRMAGEVKKLGTPLGVLRKRQGTEEGEGGGDEVEVAEIIRYKVVFSSRPEPVGREEGI